ncbi:MAG: hypothetical protein IJC71_08225 [Clostridia bacterium]|nr:hypothetical protein [Clostridia bacterium]
MTLLCAVVLVIGLTYGVSAEENVPEARQSYSFTAEESGLRASLGNLYGQLPEEIRQDWDGTDTADEITGKLREQLDLSLWLKKITEGLKKSTAEIFPSFLPLFSLILLTAAAQTAVPDSAVLKKAFLTYAGLFSAAEVFRMTACIITSVQNYLSGLCGMMNAFVPVMEAVCLLGGHFTEKAVSGGGILLLVTLIGNFNNLLLVPLTVLLFSLSAVTMTCPEVKLGGMVTGVRKCLQRLWAITAMLFSFLLGMQNLLAKAADSLGARTARFAIGTFVPVAGGLLAEAFSTVQEGLRFVRQAAGIGGILLICALLLPGIVPLFLYRLFLSLAVTVSELLGVQAAGMLAEIRGIVEFLLGIVLFTALLFVLALFLFMKVQT